MFSLTLRAEERAALDEAARGADPGAVLRGLILTTGWDQLAELLRAYDDARHSVGAVEVAVDWPEEAGHAVAKHMQALAAITGVRTDRSVNRVARAVLWHRWRQRVPVMGRPPATGETRDAAMLIRVTEDERDRIKAAAAAAGLTASEYLRRLALGDEDV